jgi:hypothetical protein
MGVEERGMHELMIELAFKAIFFSIRTLHSFVCACVKNGGCDLWLVGCVLIILALPGYRHRRPRLAMCTNCRTLYIADAAVMLT